jgi:S-DNA-T family DNA segregation ATPase FtsK/SpoIIIE
MRLQSAFVTEDEVKKVVQYLKDNDSIQTLETINLEGNQGDRSDAIFSGMVDGGDGEDDDDLYEDARLAVIEGGKASTSYLQRRLRVGYSRAARLIDMLEERGVIGPGEGSKPRQILEGARGEDEG